MIYLIFTGFMAILGIWILILNNSYKKLKEKYESEKSRANMIEQDYLRYKSEREMWDEKKKKADKEKKDLHTGTDADRFNAAAAILRNDKS